MRLALSSLLVIPAVLAAGAGSLEAASISLNISSGFLYGSGGITVADRLPVSTLCVLVADLDGNGFDPVPAGAWVGGGDVLVAITDLEYDASAGGTRAFDLTSGSSGTAGFFSRTLNVDLGQFGGRVEPVAVALRWFPAILAGVDLNVVTPVQGMAYGEFSRAVPVYPNTDGWLVPMTGGAIFDLDPLATSGLGGIDGDVAAMATMAVIPEPGLASLAAMGLLAVWRRRVRCD
jgi:hypothetical protein